MTDKIVANFYAMVFVMTDRVKARKDEGATAVEYGLIVALIAAVIVVIVATLGTQILAAFTSVSGQLPAAP